MWIEVRESAISYSREKSCGNKALVALTIKLRYFCVIDHFTLIGKTHSPSTSSFLLLFSAAERKRLGGEAEEKKSPDARKKALYSLSLYIFSLFSPHPTIFFCCICFLNQ